jgi:hypothetical protein
LRHRIPRRGGRFVGWLIYPTAIRASDAFKVLHASIKAQGLGVEQWTREMFLPRDEA